MADNRRRHANGIAVGAVAKWAVIAFFIGAIGLSYVCYKNQLHTTSKQLTSLEEELTDLWAKNEAAENRATQLRSREKISEHLKRREIKMIPIAHDRIVQVPSRRPRLVTNELRPVANEGAEK